MIYVVVTVGLVFGIVVGLLFVWAKKKHLVKLAERSASDILDEAEDRTQEIVEDSKLKTNDYVDKLHEQLEADLLPLQAGIEQSKRKIEHRRDELNGEFSRAKSKFDKRRNKISEIESSYQTKVNSIEQKKQKRQSKISEYKQQLAGKFNISLPELKDALKMQLIEEEKSLATKNIQLAEELFSLEVEKRAKRTLGAALHRFHRPHCPERGIQNINFSSLERMHRTLGKDFENVPFIEELIGVDLTPIEEKLFLNVSGFDPVRRELTRITLEKLMREKSVNRNTIERMVGRSKKQLFKKIRSDGNRLAKELELKNLHPEIRNMMGALRYRYSFSQNQHFHCAEVGWLCGLLSTELQLDVKSGRRAGMLHDIGKAMDHSIDGGHAVIGADFIDKHGENQPVVHAVRAHHYDETPDTDLAYLVIAADAISGARPGARRSTAESYMAKMNELERIGSSMPGVHQTFILSAGREVRVMVNANEIDDQQSMELSQELAKRIEDEMVYPGTIRVTVVRETLAVEYAK